MSTINTDVPATEQSLRKMHAYWQAANYLAVGQIYLVANPLLREPLTAAHLKSRPLGHWGTTPGLNFIYVHLNRVIVAYDLSLLLVTGPGHGAPAIVANAYLEGTYSERYPLVSQDSAGLARLFRQFSSPGGIPSHVGPETPGSIHEGGELGYSLSHAFGAAFDNPDLIVACVIGDGEAETGPLATSWHSNKFLNPVHDGAVLPILHLNGYKIAGPTVLARLPQDELTLLLTGYGYEPFFVDGTEPAAMHRQMADTLDTAIQRIRAIQADARTHGFVTRPQWPLIVLRSPKGWTGPSEVDGMPSAGTFRAHQLPLHPIDQPAHLRQLEGWLQSYSPEALFDADGQLISSLRALAPVGARRMSANPVSNGGVLLCDLVLPALHKYAVDVAAPGASQLESSKVQGDYMRDVIRLNPRIFRVFSPDETASNRWGAVFEVTDRCSTAEIIAGDEHVAPNGRVMEMLSEHQCEGWLEGYLLTGRHGILSCYEAFIHIIDSMFNQHAKWLKTANAVAWRAPIASLTYLLSSHVWRQEHNGFSHQDPGFIDHVVNKKPEIIRVYLPPDANTLLAVTEHCLRSRNYVNVIVAGKHREAQWLSLVAAQVHCRAGLGKWEWASHEVDGNADVVIASAGDVPTLEALAAVQLLRDFCPELMIRFVNVVDLMTLLPDCVHPHGLRNDDFDTLFSTSRPVIFAYHGYPALIHRLTYKRHNHENFHVHGYQEEGTTTTPFDMAVRNQLDRFHLFASVVDYVPHLQPQRATAHAFVARKLDEHRRYIQAHGVDMPEILEWQWRQIQ